MVEVCRNLRDTRTVSKLLLFCTVTFVGFVGIHFFLTQSMGSFSH